MKKKKNKLFMRLSILIIGFLICSSSLNTLNTQALVEEKHPHNDTDFISRSNWKWSTTEVVSTESTGESYFSSIAVDAVGNVSIVWFDYTNYGGSGADVDIFYKHCDSSTSTWTTTEVVSTESTSESSYPSLAVDAVGNVHVAWQDWTDYAGAGAETDIFYKRWNAYSSSWTTTEVVSTESIGTSSYPSLAVDAVGNVHVAWQDWTDYAGAGTEVDIFYKRWNASSSSWTTTEVVSTESIGNSRNPSLTVDSLGNVHVAWRDETDYNAAGTDRDIFYKCWNASSSSWTTTEVVSTESTDSSEIPSIAVDSEGDIHIAWYDETDYAGSGADQDIFYKSWDSSSLWTTTEVIFTESISDSRYPSLSIDSDNNLHLAWLDYTDYAGSGTDQDIFYKRWDTLFSAWTTTEVVSTESTGDSEYSSLTVDTEGVVHIAWNDRTNYDGSGADRDIFYKALTGPPLAPELAFIVPNPTEHTSIILDWNNIQWVNVYYVYRSTSYIWSVEGLNPIASVSSSDYIDTISSEGFYYYVVVAENFVGNSSHSNCQYIEVIFPDFQVPELAPILPNPTEVSSVSLAWDDIDGATDYYIYRSDTYIWSVESLTPIDTVSTNSYIDTLPSEGFFFYVIVASDGVENSTHSNCEYIQYKLPSLDEFVIVSGLILSTFAILFVVTRFRKKKI